jgi:membrane protein implicated in regulation of membrane protease activity
MDAIGIWLVLALLLLIAEAVSLGIFLLFFGFGAFFTGILLWFMPLSFAWQVAVFLVVSVALLLLLRNTMRAWLLPSKTSSEALDNLEDVMGRHGVVVEAIHPPEYGVVDLRGTTWKASADKAITVGKHVVVTGRKNLILQVESI